MSIENEIQQYEKLILLIRDTLKQDADLREKHKVADKFRFVRDRLQGLLTHLEEQARHLQKSIEQKTPQQENHTDKSIVYVYLYNAQGAVLRTWLTLLTPRVFYEYSVNRPIYAEKQDIEALVRSKPNKQQHGYLTIKINQNDIVASKDSTPKDAIGHPLLKIREGSLTFENLIAFTHNNQDYVVGAQGELVKKI